MAAPVRLIPLMDALSLRFFSRQIQRVLAGVTHCDVAGDVPTAATCHLFLRQRPVPTFQLDE